MQVLPEGYVVFTTKELERNLRKLGKTPVHGLLDEGTRKLQANPYHNTYHLEGPFSHYRVLKIGDYRLFFAVCQECRALGHQSLFGCSDCAEKKDNSVIQFKMRHRSIAYDFRQQ
jgi:mRNA-degrading endonuclease RelE of RelBE toxin-antitoxin system